MGELLLDKKYKMKTILLLAFSLLTQLSFAQKDVYLNISHFLGNSEFNFNQTGTNDLGNGFTINRLEYYISEITLTHDGGVSTHMDDLWILVNGGIEVNENLGSFPITELESISFAVGVESDYNHLDPSSYTNFHPLGPKSPSMHWGWASGYRFLAMEGLSGPNLNLVFEIHALGDANLYTVTIATTGEQNGNTLNINLDADYEKVLDQIDISSGSLYHGETGIPAEALVNCSRYVFTASLNDPNSIKNVATSMDVIVFPNPSTQTVHVTGDGMDDMEIKIRDILGKEVSCQFTRNHNEIVVEFAQKGIYLIHIYKNDLLISTQRVSVIK